MSTPRVLHVITGLNMGGAEMMLYSLLQRSAKDRHEVLSMLKPGPVGDRIAALGVPVHSLQMSRGGVSLSALLDAKNIIKRTRPDVVQGWLYHGNLLGGIAARMAGNRNIAWNICSSLHDFRHTKPQTKMVIKLGARLSGSIPKKIVCCSYRSADQHAEIGYRRQRFEVIPNGFDISRFHPDTGARARLGAQLGLPRNISIVGHVGRYHPHKDYPNLVAAASKSKLTTAHFVLVGQGLDKDNKELGIILSRHGVEDRFTLMGMRSDIPDIVAGFDLYVQSSATEGFPLVIGEAMACGVPCVVTDVGDCALVVGGAGFVAEPKNPQSLADAIDKALSLSPSVLKELGKAAREKVGNEYELSKVVGQYDQVFAAVASTANPQGAPETI